ncbi:protein nrt1/ ptr family 2.8 [Phtheirospermum japonicum]|uniref:Protein nrt1/ ptr family 2.8 n=1 Tax=Phtheirospermum japonicum TaxID=374723 RepID=A0A830B454_9LAMI|nr:protein nrt1/ ptr family 2.8 [Phtheirospermum japonicum]
MEIGSHTQAGDEFHLSSPSKSQSKKPGGWTAIAFILGNESFEKLASMSLLANITVYLRTKYNLSGILLVNIVTVWSGTSNVASILGAIVSDAYLGRFLTLLIGTIFSLLGMVAMTLTAGIPELRPPECQEQLICIEPHKWQLAFLFASLGIIAVGAGGIRPCNIAFGADQFDTNTQKGRTQLESFFNWWYFSFTIALVIALTGVVYVQTNVSWVMGFAIPTACLAASITIFLIGRGTYIYKMPRGSVFIDMAKVVAASFKKRRINLKLGDDHIYYDPPGDLEWENRKMSRIDRFRFLDRAAVIANPSELDSMGFPVSMWRLCSLQQVENLKCLFGIIPVWISGVGCFLVMDQQSTFGVLQAIQMDRSIGRHFMIPPGWMGISSMIALSIWILIYERIYIPVAKRISKRDFRMTMRIRINIGIVMSIVCMVVAGCVEKKRRVLALGQGSFVSSLHVLVLLPQFALSGLTEAFAAVALMEFFTRQLPESMRSVAGAIFFLSLSAASYFSSLIVNVMHSVTGGGGKTPWLGGHDLNDNMLDNYYYIVAVLGSMNLVYFTLFASKYVPLEKDDELELEESIETPSK